MIINVLGRYFNPFQGFIRISTKGEIFAVDFFAVISIPFRDLLGFLPVVIEIPTPADSEVSIPFRDLLGFLLSHRLEGRKLDYGFNPFQGFIRISTLRRRDTRPRGCMSFNPFQGFIRISTSISDTR